MSKAFAAIVLCGCGAFSTAGGDAMDASAPLRDADAVDGGLSTTDGGDAGGGGGGGGVADAATDPITCTPMVSECALPVEIFRFDNGVPADLLSTQLVSDSSSVVTSAQTSGYCAPQALHAHVTARSGEDNYAQIVKVFPLARKVHLHFAVREAQVKGSKASIHFGCAIVFASQTAKSDVRFELSSANIELDGETNVGDADYSDASGVNFKIAPSPGMWRSVDLKAQLNNVDHSIGASATYGGATQTLSPFIFDGANEPTRVEIRCGITHSEDGDDVYDLDVDDVQVDLCDRP